MSDVVVRPSVLPGRLGSGILHFGLGAFHRAHQAVFTEDAMASSGGAWAIEAVSMRSNRLAGILNDQGGRFTVVEHSPVGTVFREISAIRKAWSLPDQPDMIAGRLADPTIGIVTLTVTEKGYTADLSARCLDRNNPDIAHDWVNPNTPKTLLGILARGLRERGAQADNGLTILSCDNIPDNGKLLRDILLEFVGETDPGLAGWIAKHCTFPNSMVDRITPAPSRETLSLVRNALGRSDLAAVETEAFSQWVIEDEFAGPKPDWRAAGALIVPDVKPYEEAKLRMLNGAHSLIAYLGTVGGIATVRDVMAHGKYVKLIRHHMTAAAKTLDPPAGFDLDAHADDLIARFANPSIDHHCRQIAADGSQKMPQRLFAPARILLDRNAAVGTFAFATALWIQHVALSVTDPAFGELADPLAQTLHQAVQQAANDHHALVVSIGRIASPGPDNLFENEQWCRQVVRFLTALQVSGVAAALNALAQ